MPIDLLETDPPYNVAVSNARGDTIKNDNMAEDEFHEFLYSAFSNAAAVMNKGAAFYIWHADSNGLTFRACCEEAGLTIKQNLIWVKNRFTLGRQDYQWMHEPCLYGWKEGASRLCPLEDRKQSDVWDFERPSRSDEHPTMKPVPLVAKAITNSSKKENAVLDLFGGSGTTLIACEQLNRTCYMSELDPHYCDVILQRWENFTGEKAVLL